MSNPTIYDVADAAGVSSATVSRVINHPERVAKHTRKRVLSTIADLGFQPNKAAQAIGRGRSNGTSSEASS